MPGTRRRANLVRLCANHPELDGKPAKMLPQIPRQRLDLM